ncbi:hypothetical protein [Staphylococcus piscifermentans]
MDALSFNLPNTKILRHYRGLNRKE